MSATGIIFSNIHDANLPELTMKRTIASVPYGCRYRLIDFALSNMVNSNISDVNVITHYNYHSLMDHIGSGKDWDLARRSGGIKLLPPYITAYANSANSLYRTRLEALMSVGYCINSIKSDYVVLSDCDVICNINLNDMIQNHKETGADMTIAVKKMHLDRNDAKINVMLDSDKDGRITDVIAYPSQFEGEADVNLNIIVMSRSYLQQMVLDATAHGYTSMTKDIMLKNKERHNYRIYRYNGYFACISSFEAYYRANMELIRESGAREALFDVPARPIYTKVRNSAPTYYSDDARVKNSLIADGCRIEGTVENSILFRGVKIGRNTVVRNSILFQDTFTGDNVTLNCVVSDKNALVRDGITLSGAPELPFYIGKSKVL